MGENSEETMPQADQESKADETRERILQAAALVFAKKGYVRATTRALAAAADVNEVTLFRHFGNKQNLFAAVVAKYAAPAFTAAIDAQLTGEYRQDLLTMGRQILKLMMERREALRLLLCEASHFPEVREVLAQNPRQLRQSLAGYLRGQMERGVVRDLHPEAMAQAFWGMFFAYATSLEILAEPVDPALAEEELVAAFVDVFVQGTLRQER